MIVIVIMIIGLVPQVRASLGDRSYVFQKCHDKCVRSNCTGSAALRAFSGHQPGYESFFQWSCSDECKYQCMWVTVDAFQKDGLDVPQFYGKWPFVRVFGVQEPASMIFSVLNALVHLPIFTYRKLVPSTAPMYYVWHGAALVAVNAWTWSTIFHSKDTDFTEHMDYFCAFSVVLYSTFTLACRVFGTENRRRILVVGLALVLFYAKHIHFLAFVHFEYGYNMKVNVGVALLNMIGWFAWCAWKRKEQRYVWKCVASIVGIQLLLGLELGDFPPLWWTFDAHSLWHAGTAPLCLLWYSFIIDDGLYLKSKGKSELLPQKVD